MLENVNSKTFEPHVNSTFVVRHESGTEHQLKLVKVEENTKSPDVEQFSLVFTGTRDQLLPQGNYEFEHPKMGKLTLFVVPVAGTDLTVHRYQVVFARLRQK